MNKRLLIVAFYFLAMFVCGCVPSLHPLFTNDQKIANIDLEGTWQLQDSNEILQFKKAGNMFECIYVDNNGKIGKFDVSAGMLQNYLLLDIYPKSLELTENAFYRIHFPALHTFALISLTQDNLQMRFMKPDGIDKFLKLHPNAVKHEKLDQGEIILTASTKELQDFIVQYGLNENNDIFQAPKNAERLK